MKKSKGGVLRILTRDGRHRLIHWATGPCSATILDLLITANKFCSIDPGRRDYISDSGRFSAYFCLYNTSQLFLRLVQLLKTAKDLNLFFQIGER